MSLRRRRRLARWILDQIKAPVLAIHGDRDRLVPVGYARAAARAHPRWDLRVLPGIGHVPQMEAPTRWLAAVKDWLGRLSA
jgi:pimeloyl-ACP methyl ester carboxylesterase